MWVRSRLANFSEFDFANWRNSTLQKEQKSIKNRENDDFRRNAKFLHVSRNLISQRGAKFEKISSREKFFPQVQVEKNYIFQELFIC